MPPPPPVILLNFRQECVVFGDSKRKMRNAGRAGRLTFTPWKPLCPATWWHRDMETLSTLLVLCEGNLSVGLWCISFINSLLWSPDVLFVVSLHMIMHPQWSCRWLNVITQMLINQPPGSLCSAMKEKKYDPYKIICFYSWQSVWSSFLTLVPTCAWTHNCWHKRNSQRKFRRWKHNCHCQQQQRDITYVVQGRNQTYF